MRKKNELKTCPYFDWIWAIIGKHSRFKEKSTKRSDSKISKMIICRIEICLPMKQNSYSHQNILKKKCLAPVYLPIVDVNVLGPNVPEIKNGYNDNIMHVILPMKMHLVLLYTHFTNQPILFLISHVRILEILNKQIIKCNN